MIVIYGNKMCKDCRDLEKNLIKFNIEYTYVDIFESLKNMKSFLYYRDNYEILFKDVKALGGIGIPLIIENDNLYLDWENYLVSLGYKEIEKEETIAC